MKYLNMVGPQIRKLRYMRGWSQDKLAAKLQLLGWDIGRVSLAKIESRLVRVDAHDLLFFAKVFNVRLDDLFPPIDTGCQIHELVAELMERRSSSGSSQGAEPVGRIARAPRRWSD
ncbi:MAG: helix-turn-helix transcriptional regulator [Verrucomicrobiia bacterium]|jgi:transcriptional regulator with XRE-family HTH domain